MDVAAEEIVDGVQELSVDAQESDEAGDFDRQRAYSEPLPDAHPAYNVGYVYSSAMLMHSHPEGHPETPERIQRIYNLLAEKNLLQLMKQIPIRKAQKHEVMLVHEEDLWHKVMAIAAMSAQDVHDSMPYYESISLYVNQSTPMCAQFSCGGAIEATLAVARGEVQKSFAIVRPPGHHSEPFDHMGFCFFNNVAVAAKVVQQLTPVKKILILDWDVHHGNGTQRAFYSDPSVLYISLHRFDGGTFYPCGDFGSYIKVGDGEGTGFSVNIPWEEGGMGDADYLLAFQKVIMPIAYEFAPELVIISAGFDAADGDDLGECHVTPTGYAHMTHMLAGLADGKLVVALEGGYSLDAIAKSSLAVTKVLLGQSPPSFATALTATESGTETVWLVATEMSKYWRSVDPKAIQPKEELEEITYSIPEILKMHRQEDLFQKHDMMVIPTFDLDMSDRYASQILATPDVLDNKIVVIFVHELGHLLGELNGYQTCDMSQELSYLLDVSKQVIDWIKGAGYGLIDISLIQKTPLQDRGSRRLNTGKQAEEKEQENLVTYVWDNYVQLCSAKRVVFIGHGPGCAQIMRTIADRASTVIQKMTCVVQIVGMGTIPRAPKEPAGMRKWYQERSLVLANKSHVIFSNGKIFASHGNVMATDVERLSRMIVDVLPIIKTFVSAAVDALED